MTKVKKIKKKSSEQKFVHFSWSDQLCAVLAATKLIVGPPIGSNSDFARFLDYLIPSLKNLNHLTEEEFLDLIGSLSKLNPDLSENKNTVDENFQLLSLEEIEKRISDPNITKKQLISIIYNKFEASKGTISGLNRDALIDRIKTFIRNEKSHQTIERLTRAGSNTDNASSPLFTNVTVEHDREADQRLV